MITGALGQDGIILTKKLIKKNFKVYGIIKNDKKIKLKVSNVIYKKLNLAKFNLLEKYITKINPDCLIHCGSENPNFMKAIKKNFIR